MSNADKESTTSEETDSEVDHHDLARRIQLGEFVRRTLSHRGWKQGTLAEIVGCDQTTISKIINAKQRASEKMVQRILDAFELPHDYFDKLPSTEFEPGSDGFRLKSMVIGAYLECAIPLDKESCARVHIAQKWSDPEYRELPRSPNLEDAVWASLVADRYFEVEEGIFHANYDHTGQLKYFISSYISHVCSALFRIAKFDDLKRTQIFAQLDRHLDQYELSLANPQQLIDCIDQINLALANNDRLIASILRGYTNGFRLFLQANAAAVRYADNFEGTLKPIMACLYKVLKRAMADLNSPTPRSEWHLAVDSYVAEIQVAIKGWADSIRPEEIHPDGDPSNS